MIKPNRTGYRVFTLTTCLFAAACGGTVEETGAGGGGSSSASSGTGGAPSASSSSASSSGSTSSGSCDLAASTSPTDTVNAAGCHVLSRDASACADARKAQGLSGFWLKFSCRVSLSSTGGVVKAAADGQPDYETNYYPTSNACHEDYPGGMQNPNLIYPKNYVIQFPLAQDMNPQPMMGVAVVGLAVNGVPIFGAFAAPGDDIYTEAMTFDRCGGHPQMQGAYHYHSEPHAISSDDNHFIGVMRDGYPVYGRKDADGTYPTLDAYGGHTGVTLDSPDTAVYHYHVNEQTSTTPGTAGQKQWFLTKGGFRGTPAPCGSCN